MWFAASQAAVHERPMNSTLGCLVPATAPGIPAYKQMKEECLLAAFGDGAPLGCSVCNVPWLRALFGSFYFVISEHTCLLVLTGGLGRPKKLEAQTDKMKKMMQFLSTPLKTLPPVSLPSSRVPRWFVAHEDVVYHVFNPALLFNS